MQTRLEFWAHAAGEEDIVLIETDSQGFSTIRQVGILWPANTPEKAQEAAEEVTA